MDVSRLRIVLLYFLNSFGTVFSSATVSLTAPVNPVEEGAILSVHCQVSNLEKHHEVTLLKITDGISERLTLDADVLPRVEERVFLAQRHRPDGSVVFFLSIINLVRDDEGTYQCEVRNKAEDMMVEAERTIDVNMLYFPKDKGPKCHPEGGLDILENSISLFNCSSDDGNPSVSLQWLRAGTQSVLSSKQQKSGGKVFSVLRTKVTKKEQSAIFICKVTSVAFPDQSKTCHVGPLRVISDPSEDHTIGSNTEPEHKDKEKHHQDSVVTDMKSNIDTDREDVMPEDDFYVNCESQCSYNTSKVLYWMLSTIIIGAIAVLFLCISITLIIRFNRLRGIDNDDYLSIDHTRRERIYVDLHDTKPCKDKVYMGLQLQVPPMLGNANAQHSQSQGQNRMFEQ